MSTLRPHSQVLALATFLLGCGQNASEPSLSFRPVSEVTALAVASDGSVIAGTGADGVFRSSDDGQSWSHVLPDPPRRVFDGGLAAAPSGYVFAATLRGLGCRGDPLQCFSEEILFRSQNNGETWEPVPVEGLYSPVARLAADSKGGVFGTYIYAGGIARSPDNGTTWTHVTSFEGWVPSLFYSAPFVSLAVSSSDLVWAASESCIQCVWRLADNAEHFIQVFTGLEGMGRVVTGPGGNVLLADILGSEVAHSSDEGVTWRNTRFTTSSPIRTLAMAPDGHILVVTDSGIYRASTVDYAWTQLTANLAPERPYAQISALVIKPDGTIFAGVNAGEAGLVFRSRDGGTTWTRIDLMVPLRP